MCDIDWSAIAAWVQAIGSIAAIWAAGRFVIRQERLRHADTLRSLAGLTGAARFLLDEARRELEKVGGGDDFAYFDSERLRRLQEFFLQVPPLELGSTTLVLNYQDVFEALGRAKDNFDLAFGSFRQGHVEHAKVMSARVDDEGRLIADVDGEVLELVMEAERNARRWLWR